MKNKTQNSCRVAIPLVVDLDGTLLRSDLLLETGMVYLQKNPLGIIKPIYWIAKGKAELKYKLAESTSLDVSILPYNSDVLELVKEERKKGRKVVLATASWHSLADRIAEYLNLFDDVIATNSQHNLSAQQKRDVLVERYGIVGFDYVGNSNDDLCVWRASRKAYVVNPNAHVLRCVKNFKNLGKVINSNHVGIGVWLKALRLHQWLKNILLFIPLLTAHQLTNLKLFLPGVFAFFIFGLAASSVYIFNDLLDLENDRKNSIKRLRPFAAGLLQIHYGLLVSFLLLITSLTVSQWLLPWQFTTTLCVYYLMTLAYSSFIKRLTIADVIILALLYTLRIIAGTFTFGFPLTYWILAFSLFLFLSLAFIKRYTELQMVFNNGESLKVNGRGYYSNDMPIIASLGAASGYIAVMVLALYIDEQMSLTIYRYPQLIWFACPLMLFWISRLWLLAHRNQMHHDPVIFAIKDRTSWTIAGLLILILWIAV